jgi:hypothetical protein
MGTRVLIASTPRDPTWHLPRVAVAADNVHCFDCYQEEV